MFKVLISTPFVLRDLCFPIGILSLRTHVFRTTFFVSSLQFRFTHWGVRIPCFPFSRLSRLTCL